MTYLIHAIAAASLLAGCAAAPSAAPVKDPSMDTSVTLVPERTVAVGPNALLRYDGVADSRCPPGVQCVWAGELAYKFTLTNAGGKESFGLTAAKPAFDAASVAGLHIALGSNPVPPVQPANAPVPAHPVTLDITHK
ncbi:MAG: hypothetical protein V4631_09835 [Pseudomonadota bacterium]